jgi:hypothetical protein
LRILTNAVIPQIIAGIATTGQNTHTIKLNTPSINETTASRLTRGVDKDIPSSSISNPKPELPNWLIGFSLYF